MQPRAFVLGLTVLLAALPHGQAATVVEDPAGDQEPNLPLTSSVDLRRVDVWANQTTEFGLSVEVTEFQPTSSFEIIVVWDQYDWWLPNRLVATWNLTSEIRASGANWGRLTGTFPGLVGHEVEAAVSVSATPGSPGRLTTVLPTIFETVDSHRFFFHPWDTIRNFTVATRATNLAPGKDEASGNGEFLFPQFRSTSETLAPPTRMNGSVPQRPPDEGPARGDGLLLGLWVDPMANASLVTVGLTTLDLSPPTPCRFSASVSLAAYDRSAMEVRKRHESTARFDIELRPQRTVAWPWQAHFANQSGILKPSQILGVAVVEGSPGYVQMLIQAPWRPNWRAPADTDVTVVARCIAEDRMERRHEDARIPDLGSAAILLAIFMALGIRRRRNL